MFFNPTGHEALIQPIGRDFGEVSYYDNDDDDDDDDCHYFFHCGDGDYWYCCEDNGYDNFRKRL